MVRQALFVDSKAEKSPANGRIQVSQSSLRVLFKRPGGPIVDVPGMLPSTIEITRGAHYLATTLFVHYHYTTSQEERLLKSIILAALPNGRLEERYVTSINDTIWNVGPDSPLRGEKQRARLSFTKLAHKRAWRVQRIGYDNEGTLSFSWQD